MANSELPGLSATTTIAPTDIIYVVVDPGGAGEADRKMTYADFLAEIKTDAGTYTSYTPTVSQNGARTTSAMTARYCQIGKMVFAWGQCTVSNAGTAGNAINVSLPVSPAAGQTFCGVGAVKDTGTAFYDALVLITGSNIGFFSTVQAAASAENYIGATPSFALANTDQIYWRIAYEAA